MPKREPELKSKYLMGREAEAAGRLMVACGGQSNTDEPVHPDHLALAAMVGKRAVGLIVGKVNDEFTELLFVGVVPKRRRQGVATFLLKELMKIPKVARAGRIRLWVNLEAGNVPAMSWLKARGFHGSYEDGDIVKFGLPCVSEPLLIEV